MRVARRRAFGVGSLVAAVLLSGCGETYCQSGPKYGTQCYSMNDTEWQQTQVRGDFDVPSRPEPPQPSPGCAVLGASGAYLVSGACLPQRVPAPGAVR